MELTKKDKARVFAMYVGQKLCYKYEDRNGAVQLRDGIILGTVGSTIHFNPIRIDGTVDVRTVETRYAGYATLLLRPLSAITDEDAIEVAKIILPNHFLTNAKGWKVTRDYAITGFPYVKVHNPKKVSSVQIDCTLCNFSVYDMEDSATDSTDMRPSEITQFLIQRGYAVPLFIAPGQPCNGMTAIEMGIAIDATTIPQP